MLHSSNEVKRPKPQRMPPARRWKAIRASDLKPGDIVVRTKSRLHGAGRFFWANPEAQGSKSVWDMYNVGLMENKTKDWSTRYYLVTNLDVAEKYKKEPTDFAAIGYEMIRLISKPLKECKSDIVCTKEKLASIRGVDSSVGILNMSENREIQLKEYNLYTINNKNFEKIK